MAHSGGFMLIENLPSSSGSTISNRGQCAKVSYHMGAIFSYSKYLLLSYYIQIKVIVQSLIIMRELVI